jgi:preprotein translocase subunit SecF
MRTDTHKKFDSGKYDFLGKAKYLVPAAFLLVLLGLFEMGIVGLNYGIDFVGGTEIQLQFQNQVNTSDVRNLVVTELGYDKAAVQAFDDGREVLVRVPSVEGKTDKETSDLQQALVAKIVTGVKDKFKENPVELRRVDSVGPQVGQELKRNALLAAFYSLIMMLIYIGLRFDYKYAPGAVFCLFFDATVTMSIYVLMGREVNVQTLAAILTLIGYSLNDTIVTFDRVRENEKLFKDVDFYSIVNRAVNDTLPRTILTSFSTLLAVGALYLFSDGVVQQIAFTLAIGILIGSFSTIYIAAPLVIIMDKLEQKREQARLRAAAKA